jgi:hypothetical protein
MLSKAGLVGAAADAAMVPAFDAFAAPPLEDTLLFDTESDNTLPTGSSSSLSDATLTEYLHKSERRVVCAGTTTPNHQKSPERRKRVRNHVGSSVFRKSLYKNTRHACSIGASRCYTLHTAVSKFLTRVTVSNRLSDAPFTTRVGYQRLLIDSAQLSTACASLVASCKMKFNKIRQKMKANCGSQADLAADPSKCHRHSLMRNSLAHLTRPSKKIQRICQLQAKQELA